MRPTHRFACALVIIVITGFFPAHARADLRLTAFGGLTRVDEANKRTIGGAVTFGSLIGLEVEAARAWLGSFDGVPSIDVDAHLTTVMGNFVVRLPTGPLQPYGTVGVGTASVTGEVTVPGLGRLVSATARDVAWNIGGGLYLMPAPNFGLRADVRHFQTGDVTWDNIPGIGDLPLPKFDFWRATVGATLKF